MSDPLSRLYDAVLERRDGDAKTSRTARLLAGSRTRIIQKLGEEAVEVVIDATREDPAAVIRESADLLYHLVVLWAAMDIPPVRIGEELERREALYGIAEKISKDQT